MLCVKFCSMEVFRESHNFSLDLVSFFPKSSGKDKLYFSTLRASVDLLFTPMLTTRNKILTICPTLNQIIWKLTMTVDFKALTEITDSYHAQKVQKSLKAIAFNCGITKDTKHINGSPVFNFTSMRPTCLLYLSYYLSQHQNHSYQKKTSVEKRQWSKKSTAR